MRSCSLDTNCLLALVLPGRDIEKKKVTELLITQECYVSDIAISEAQYVLNKAYELPRDAVAGNLESILNIEEIRCNRAILRRVIALYRNHPALSFNDIYLATQAGQDRVAPLYTFDKKLSNQMPEARILS